jgi:hypothetical protein
MCSSQAKHLPILNDSELCVGLIFGLLALLLEGLALKTCLYSKRVDPWVRRLNILLLLYFPAFALKDALSILAYYLIKHHF